MRSFLAKKSIEFLNDGGVTSLKVMRQLCVNTLWYTEKGCLSNDDKQPYFEMEKFLLLFSLFNKIS